MLLSDILINIHNTKVYEGANITWGRIKNRIVQKYRCTSGSLQGRLVTSPSDCFKPIKFKKKQKMKIISIDKNKKNN